MRSNRIRTTVLAATALLAALSLTACNGDDGAAAGQPGAASPAASADADGTAKPSADATPAKDSTADTDTEPAGDAKPKAPAGTKAPGGGTGGGKGSGGGSTSPVTCVASNTKITVTKVSRPINHLLLTLTNTGSRPCYAYYAPMLRFDDAQAVFPVLQDSKPQAVVTLEPGQSAYAGIGLTGEPNGRKPYKSEHLGVFLADRNNQSESDATELTLPGTTYWDDNGFVTYWQTEMDNALL
ncbi:DUF4232 domain-containing protein [Streptomyces sp. NPDC059783]|uniref:DUF4232 domain-containing protein n=1 Tax=Streptomyces sp. NPDC059783 TaxID=3346944 RepID=UPI00366066E7